jgi:hypothetical protein
LDGTLDLRKALALAQALALVTIMRLALALARVETMLRLALAKLWATWATALELRLVHSGSFLRRPLYLRNSKILQ